VDKQLPLIENTFRYGSQAFLDLWSEARYLYLREIIHVNDDDKEILLETNLGEYGIYEGKKVPLDLLMLEEGFNLSVKANEIPLMNILNRAQEKGHDNYPFYNELVAKIGQEDIDIDEIKNLWPGLPKPKMRVCFDLDNTLVTYPVIPNDYATVKPIKKMIDLAKKLHSDGHTIIVHTARRMLTHKNNIGAVIKDIGPITFKTLEDFSIPYHELIFGKPYADIYIDDKSLNPYFNNISNFGYFPDIFDKKKPLNSLSANKFNTLKLTDRGFIEKTGPENTLRGEIYYYKHIPDSLKSYFPKYIDSSDDRLVIEHIKGVPVFSLYKANLISEHHIDRLCEFLDILHSFKGFAETTITSDNVSNNYKQKLIRRFAFKEDYPFEDAELIQVRCLDSIDRYLTNRISIVDYIHGDFWFSNIIFDFQGKIKCIDMKGQVDGILTTGGDPMYDYGKLYQSILGYDCVLNGVKCEITGTT
jgi:capsule biosynthesis phosphatase